MTDTRPPSESAPRDGRGAQTVYHPDLEWRRPFAVSKPGDRFVRIATHKGFTRVGAATWCRARARASPRRASGALMQRVKHCVLGSPIPTAREVHERLTKVKALAVFSSDALSSVAYATEEIMKVLVLAGVGVLYLTLPISVVIVLLLAIVVLSLPADDPRLPVGRRQLHRRQRQPGHAAGPDRRRPRC